MQKGSQTSQNTTRYIKKLEDKTWTDDIRQRIQEFDKQQITKLDEIKAIRDKIDGMSAGDDPEGYPVKAKQYLIKYLDYIRDIILTKLAKDAKMTELLDTVYSQLFNINTQITVYKSKEKEVNKNILLKINNNIVSNTDNSLANFKNEIDTNIQNCINELKILLEEFINNIEERRDQEQQGGSNLQNVEGLVSLNDNTKINNYKSKLKIIKEGYEKGLKQNIEDFVKICKELKKLIGGYKRITMTTLKKTIKTTERKYGIDLDALFPTNEPFVMNKKIFDDIATEIGLTAQDVKQNAINVDKEVLSGSPSRISFISPFPKSPVDNESSDDESSGEDPPLSRLPGRGRVPQSEGLRGQDARSSNEEDEIRVSTDITPDNINVNANAYKETDVNHEIIRGYISIFASADTIIDDNKIKTTDNEHKALKNRLENLKNKNRVEYNATKIKLSEIYKEMLRIINEQEKTRGYADLKKELDKLIVPKTKGGRHKRKSTKSKKKQSGGFVRGGVLFPESFYRTDVVM